LLTLLTLQAGAAADKTIESQLELRAVALVDGRCPWRAAKCLDKRAEGIWGDKAHMRAKREASLQKAVQARAAADAAAVNNSQHPTGMSSAGSSLATLLATRAGGSEGGGKEESASKFVPDSKSHGGLKQFEEREDDWGDEMRALNKALGVKSVQFDFLKHDQEVVSHSYLVPNNWSQKTLDPDLHNKSQSLYDISAGVSRRKRMRSTKRARNGGESGNGCVDLEQLGDGQQLHPGLLG
jgi:hypothetical protein